MSDAGRKTLQGAELTRALRDLLGPLIEVEGYELVELEIATDRMGSIVRLYIDTVPPSTELQGVTIDDCTHVSRKVGRTLDEADILTAEYRLEVSSPGVYRPLTKPEHFERALGSRVRVKTFEKLDGRRVFVGKLQHLADDRLQVEVDGRIYEVPIAQVAKANLEPLFD